VPKLSVTIITKNEAQHVGDALQSVAWADEIVLVDSGSTDDTLAIARRFTDRVSYREWHGYGDQKNHAASLAAHDWILSIDADERVTPALADEIRALLREEPAARGYRIPRVSWHLGRWIRSTDWYPDAPLRLYDRRAARWQPRLVHESLTLDGHAGRLQHFIKHYAYRSLSHHLEKIDWYTTLASQQLHEEGHRANPLDIALHPPLAFLRNYLLRGGIRDGAAGLIVSAMNSYYVFLKLAKLWELQCRSADRKPETADPRPQAAASRPHDRAQRSDEPAANQGQDLVSGPRPPAR
jgi:glycosyltransferase involved in cell wall biosynthesis